ncbi:MAG: thioredoxin domain-containing protein [Flavobacteriales bacterium]|nr:thioredoxin domain-containing protein [Flavobacteriales bacterium]
MRYLIILGSLLFFTTSCNSQHEKNDMTEEHKYTNSLVNETSPYLLQHAHNPVNWHPWNEETLAKAKKEDKLLLISIGYSACHWCHVMEHESFEDSAVAKVMNDNFICIKVDREERPDVDQIYMTAVQLMNNRGGWPLNCIALPNGQPFWGGTYFRKDDWKKQILQMANIYKTDKNRVIEFAGRLTKGIQQTENIVENTDEIDFKWKDLDNMVSPWSEKFDNTEGGTNGAPKFPMPNAYNFLLKYGHLSNNPEVSEHVELTLDKMAFGGIYDQIGGGFARYSVDKYWKAPHFEKMLYDNGQLVSLYSEAYLKHQKPLYKEVVFETLEFIERELMAENGAFYSALDADSEGEEGKFYVWNEQELKSLIIEDFSIFKDYYNINGKGLWEHGNYILLRKESKERIAKKHTISISDLESKIKNWKKVLMGARDKRIRPGLDDKSLTSWNSLMLKGYIDAYMTFGVKHHLDIALKNGNFIVNTQMSEDGKLLHSYKDGRSTINAYLEDYSLTISAFIRLYEATFDTKWLTYSEKLTEYAIAHFYDTKSGMFFFTSDLDPELVARKMEINDNVIPASNSVMSNSLFDLGTILGKDNYKEMSIKMLNNVKPDMDSYASGYANYATLMLKQVSPYYEIAIVGEDAHDKTMEMNTRYNPNTLFIGSFKESNLELLEGKYMEGTTMIYVCENKVCQLPTAEIKQALKQIK